MSGAPFLVAEEPDPDAILRDRVSVRSAPNIDRARVLASLEASERPGVRVAIYQRVEVYQADLPQAQRIEQEN